MPLYGAPFERASPVSHHPEDSVDIRCRICHSLLAYTSNKFYREESSYLEKRFYFAMSGVFLRDIAVKIDNETDENPHINPDREEIYFAARDIGRDLVAVQMLECRSCGNIFAAWTTKSGGIGGPASLLAFGGRHCYAAVTGLSRDLPFKCVSEPVSEVAQYYFDLASPPQMNVCREPAIPNNQSRPTDSAVAPTPPPPYPTREVGTLTHEQIASQLFVIHEGQRQLTQELREFRRENQRNNRIPETLEDACEALSSSRADLEAQKERNQKLEQEIQRLKEELAQEKARHASGQSGQGLSSVKTPRKRASDKISGRQSIVKNSPTVGSSPIQSSNKSASASRNLRQKTLTWPAS